MVRQYQGITRRKKHHVIKAAVTRFQRLDGTGETVEYRTTDTTSSLLAYVDLNKDGSRAACDVFYPYRGTSRHYTERDAAKALKIVWRHLKSENYSSTGE